jgi:hypothetical protein
MNKEFTILVAGASGATGQRLVAELLKRGHNVRVIVRSPDSMPASIINSDRVSIIHASIMDLSDADMARHTAGCDAVASCLGHNISVKGMFLPPRRLVTDAVRRLCDAIKANNPETPVKFLLMNTTANRNRDLNEPESFGQKAVFSLLRVVLPPHVDNEKAADYLRTQIGQSDKVIEWVAVRPDGLIDEEEVTEYDLYPSPIRSPIFDPGKTSRINVGHFMAELITNDDTWKQWKGQMPVIYNRTVS